MYTYTKASLLLGIFYIITEFQIKLCNPEYSCYSISLQNSNFSLFKKQLQKDPVYNNKEIVKAYLLALKRFDHLKMKSWLHPSMNYPDSLMKDYREFEKNMDTKWSYKILRLKDDSVFVRLSESNFFYDCLGVGNRIQNLVYVIKDHLIFNILTLSIYPSHDDYSKTINKFTHWLNESPFNENQTLLNNGNLVYNGRTALILKPLLKKWKKLQFE